MTTKKSYRRRRRKQAQLIQTAAFFLIICVISGGAFLLFSSKKIQAAYSYEDRLPMMNLALKKEYATTFASDLCVIQNEGQFSDGTLTAAAVSIFDVTNNEVVFSNHGYERIYPASMTKIMTALIVLKYGNLDDMVTVDEGSVITEYAASLCGIQPGDVISLNDLLYGLMMPSGNDAGNAIALHMADTVEDFGEWMTREAKLLGATNTNFKNPHGLHSEDHYSTAYDLYLIFNELLKYEKFLDVINEMVYTAEYTNGNGEAVSQSWVNGNWFMIGQATAPDNIKVLGGKTGTTQAAGYCLILLSQDTDGNQYISVVSKAETRPSLYAQMTTLLKKAAN